MIPITLTYSPLTSNLCMCAECDSSVRSLCAVLLRRNLPLGEPMLLTRLKTQLQMDLKSGLLRSLTEERADYIRFLLCDTIAELAQITLYRDEWPELLPFLQQLAVSNEPKHRESALVILGKIGDALPDVHAGSLESLVDVFARYRSSRLGFMTH